MQPAPQDPATTAAQRPICYCFNVTEAAVRAHFSKPGATYETLVSETQVTTKCTACRLDLDLILDSLHRSSSSSPAPTPADRQTAKALRRAYDLTDAGFLVNNGEITTLLRIDNQGLLFRDHRWIVPYSYTIRVLASDGRITHTQRGSLGRGDTLEVDFSTIAACPPLGWFLVSLYPQEEGLSGTVRPQLNIRGKHWCSSVHTQLVSMACHHKTALLRTEDHKLNALVSLINTGRRQTKLDLTLYDGQGDLKATVILPPLGSHLADLDEIFPDVANEALLTLSVRSDAPVCKHLVLRHRDGSWSQNHFPNIK